MCDEVAVMYLGKIVEKKASVREIFKNPQHPYTQGLLRSVPKMGDTKKKRLDSIEGTVPVPINLPKRCNFYDRCEQRIEGLCDKQKVSEVEVSPNHWVSCFHYIDK